MGKVVDYVLVDENWEVVKNDKNQELIKVSGKLNDKSNKQIELFFKIQNDKVLPVDLTVDNEKLGPLGAVIFVGSAIQLEETNKK